MIFLAAVDDTITYNGNGTSGAFIGALNSIAVLIVLPYLVTTTALRIGMPQAYDVPAGRYGILDELAGINLALRSEEFRTPLGRKATPR